MRLLTRGQDFETWNAALAAGRYAEAVRLASAAADPVESARALAEIHYSARDPRAALAHAQEGLRLAPSHLLLAHRAAAASLWLGSAPDAREAVERLSGIVEANESLSESDRTAWRLAAAKFQADAERLSVREAERVRTARQARVTVALVGLLALASLAWAVRPARSA